jgi:hypothetical protein
VHYAAPVRTQHFAAPVRTRHFAAPVRTQHFAAPVRTRHFAAPVRTQHFAAPVRTQHFAAPVRTQHFAAPVRTQHFAAPVRSRQAAPAPFMQRVAPQRIAPQRIEQRQAPFMQYVRNSPRVQRTIVTQTVVSSPLVRSVYASRTAALPVVYHPRYIAGRVIRVARDEIVVDPVAATMPIVVRDVVVGVPAPAIPVGSVVTLPVIYTNGVYQMYVPQSYTYAYDPYAYNPYGYAQPYDYTTAYPQQYGYSYAPPMYCNGGSSSSLMYAALLPALLSVLTGNSSSFNSSDLASVALTAALSGNGGNCYAYNQPYYSQPYYSQPYYSQSAYYAPVSYAEPISYAVAQAVPTYYTPQYAYANTPYDNCMWTDEDNDDQDCAVSPNAYGYNSYATPYAYAPYTPQQVQGVVVGQSGNMLMVLGANGKPTFVYDAPALQSGYTNGPISNGSIVDAYGYYSGNTFVATAIV